MILRGVIEVKIMQTGSNISHILISQNYDSVVNMYQISSYLIRGWDVIGQRS